MTKARDGVEDLKTIDANLAAKAPIASPVFTGNVGLGTSSPDERLHVMESSAGSVTAHTESVIVAEANGNCYFSAIGTTGAGLLMASTAGNEIGRINYGFSGNIMQFYTNNAERIRLDADGLKFNGDTAAANALDDYEEGAFIPVVRGSTNAGSFSASNAHIGRYTKIGDVCTLNFIIAGTLSNATGSYAQFNLPFTVKAGTQATGRFSYVDTPNLNHLDFSSYVNAGQTLGYFIIKTASANTPAYPAPSSFMPASMQIYGTVTYHVA